MRIESELDTQGSITLPLAVGIERGALVVRIGAATLAHAVTNAEWANPYDEQKHDYIRTFAITDALTFAADVRRALLAEREDGSSLLTDVLDKASEAALDDGSEACEYEQQIAHGATAPCERAWAITPPSSPARAEGPTPKIGEGYPTEAAIRNEVLDKLSVYAAADTSPIPLHRTIVKKQVEDFLVEMIQRAYSPAPAAGGAPRTKGIYIGAPACFALEEAIRPICDAFGCYSGNGIRGCYVVGSALERPDWRDIDVRLMLDDASFAEVFPDAGEHWENDARWLALTVAISERLSRLTGLPIDFQFQPMTHANARHKGRRNAIGLRISKPVSPPQGQEER